MPVPATDQDWASRFSTGVPGCGLRTDVGARTVSGVPTGGPAS
ncbi:hypothetical protein [Pseudonocardia hydrocarbonoxydans]|nr:hypothetical protein [Pseudonocardia hydrocarbonoxydans]